MIRCCYAESLLEGYILVCYSVLPILWDESFPAHDARIWTSAAGEVGALEDDGIFKTTTFDTYDYSVVAFLCLRI